MTLGNKVSEQGLCTNLPKNWTISYNCEWHMWKNAHA